MALEEDERRTTRRSRCRPFVVDRAGESEGASGGYISGRGAFGVDIYDEVPRIHYEPDDEDAAMLGGEDDDDDLGPLGVSREQLAAAAIDPEEDEDYDEGESAMVLEVPQ